MLTGGLGGLGMLTATWAAGNGCNAVILLGRSGVLSSGSASSSAALLLAGELQVVLAKADVSLSEDASGAMHVSSSLEYSLGAIIHAAGVQTEARLLKQTPQTMRTAAAPKLDAFRQCALAAPGAPLAVNLLFSSVSSVTGNSGHANYAGSNAALDAIAEERSHMGTPIVAVQWGAWASVGTITTDIAFH